MQLLSTKRTEHSNESHAGIGVSLGPKPVVAALTVRSGHVRVIITLETRVENETESHNRTQKQTNVGRRLKEAKKLGGLRPRYVRMLNK